MPPPQPDLFVSHLVSIIGEPVGLQALDVGCGRGRNALFLARHGAAVVAVDHMVSMVDACRRASLNEKLPVRCVAGKAESAPFALGSFDLVLCTSVLESMDLPVASAAAVELHRVTRPGGTALVVTAALEGSDPEAGGAPPLKARLTSRDLLTTWFQGWHTLELLHLQLVAPASAAVSAQWALIARRNAD
ncbi:MAG: class I SAM-dependent methyltransferase [Dehalococcoidia bacterium]|nr:class I SAM-dependent methyltransferase [Dehalococcoidia bacterium]